MGDEDDIEEIKEEEGHLVSRNDLWGFFLSFLYGITIA